MTRCRWKTAVSSLLMAMPVLAAEPGSADWLAQRDADNKQLAASLMAQPQVGVQPLSSRYNHLITYGQSLASAAEGWPALSVTPGYDNLMLGEAVRSGAASGGAFRPVGGAQFKPLTAVVQRHLKAMEILTPAETATLSKHAQEEGESVEVGAANMARRLYLQQQGDPQHLLLVSNAATSGRSVSQLAKGGDYDEYKRVLGAVKQAKTLADEQQASYSVSAFFWLQGEFDYSHTNGGINDKDRYKRYLLQLRSDLNADTAVAMAGQEKMPAFFSYQTDAKSSIKDGSLAIGMAQWELAQEEEGWYLVGPVYPYVDKGTHLAANGYRWFGQMLGRAYHRVVVEGRNWLPLAPARAMAAGKAIYIDFLVPHPPLAFDQPYIGHRARDIENKGFVALDALGKVPVERVDIVADTVVRLTLGRELDADARLVYAGFDTGGAGQLRDSDPALADSVYEYLPEAGMPGEANIAALVGKPYPLHNWSIAFDIPVSGAGK